ncbi:hypothetical protein WBJ53_26280 [Spirosoma sp. SC4-14]|uniref:hypothetical protein n=1 Tax=Spirosoma sp. SC4-14 TaxID=3128900 RepID=UPI0030D5A4F4
MNISRVEYLFNRPTEPGDRDRLKIVLKACCQAAKDHQKGRGHFLPLTHDLNGFSIDEVMANIPQGRYRIVEVMKTIRELRFIGFLEDLNSDLEVITLTNKLFAAIAEEWAYERGSRPQRISDTKIFAPTLELAGTIYRRRLALQKAREEVAA